MRIRIINPNTTQAITEALARIGGQVAAPGTIVTAVTPRMGPPAIEGFYDEAFAAIGVLDEIRRGDAEGCDGYVVACFGDPGLEAAREVTARPVVGIAEAAMRFAGFVSGGFSIVSMVERVRPMLDRAVRANGMGERCRSIRMVGVPLLDFGEREREALIATCRSAVEEDRAECIVLGSAGLARHAPLIADTLGVPVIDGVAAAVKVVESLGMLGLATSKLRSYQLPAPKPYSGDFARFSPESAPIGG